MTETYRYTVYGRPLNASSLGNPYLYTARRYDNLAAIYYYRARFYHPDLRRFLQPDPIGYAAGMNLYAYVGNSPMNWIDPWGLRQLTIDEVHKLQEYFGFKIIYSSVNLEGTLSERGNNYLPYQPRLPYNLFKGNDDAKEVILDNPGIFAKLGHEIMHDWQRGKGRNVSAEALLPQAADTFGFYDCYAYDASINDPQKFLEYFKAATVEQQAAIVEQMIYEYETNKQLPIVRFNTNKYNFIRSYLFGYDPTGWENEF